jgi:hypothetical protein
MLKKSLILTVLGITIPCLLITKKWPWQHDLASLRALASGGNMPTTESIAMSSSQPAITEEQAALELAKLKLVSIVETRQLAKKKPPCGNIEVTFMGSDASGLTTIPNVSQNENLCITIGLDTFAIPPRSKTQTYIVGGWSRILKL